MKHLKYSGPGIRIDKRLAEQLPYSRSFFGHLIERECIRVTSGTDTQTPPSFGHLPLTPQQVTGQAGENSDGLSVGKIVKKSYVLKEGDEIVIQSLERFVDGGILEEAAYVNIKLKTKNGKLKIDEQEIVIMLEKKDYMVIYKPKGVLSHPNSVRDLETPSVVASIFHYMKNKAKNGKLKPKNLPSNGNFVRAGLVHRLDKDTDGLMIVAKTEQGLQYFKHLFQQKSLAESIQEKEDVSLKKYYRAVCELTPQGQEFLDGLSLPHYIIEDVVPKVPHPVVKEGITKVLVVHHSERANATEGSREIGNSRDPSLHSGGRVTLDLEILTGRTHQIRYHLSKYGIPIVGDYLYGREADEKLQLTAYKLEFEDIDGEKISLYC